jgi:hypothetical protein
MAVTLLGDTDVTAMDELVDHLLVGDDDAWLGVVARDDPVESGAAVCDDSS